MIFWEEWGPWPFGIAILMCAVLAIAGLQGRRIGIERGLKMVAAWLAIFIVVMIVFTWWQP